MGLEAHASTGCPRNIFLKQALSKSIVHTIRSDSLANPINVLPRSAKMLSP